MCVCSCRRLHVGCSRAASAACGSGIRAGSPWAAAAAAWRSGGSSSMSEDAANDESQGSRPFAVGGTPPCCVEGMLSSSQAPVGVDSRRTIHRMTNAGLYAERAYLGPLEADAADLPGCCR